ncbi:MAG: helix-turn-helix domain-containing protein [Limnohabitans sp.]|nr:MAG: helix-turn-helix domain-containing protein [Limnohabitans sp.]
MARSRVIPNYDLYGDSSRIEDSGAFNFEWIPQRSALYNWLIHPHRHDSFIQVLYLTQGQVEVQIEHAQQTLQAPCVMLIPAGHVHGFRFSRDTQGPVVTAMQKPLESAAAVMMPALLETIRTPRLLSLHAEMRYIDQLMPLFLALEHESRTPAAGQVAAGTSLLLALMVQVHRISQLSDSARSAAHYSISRKAQQIEKFRSLLDKQFRSEHSLQPYAEQVGVSVGQLSRLCREVLGKSSLEVMNDRLIQEAQRELVYTSLPIKQLASELGFEDDAYFSRFFRKHTGVSPKAYRASALARMVGDAPAGH